ncbi:MAG: esterase-like activity of phytase family protein [Calditrichia bacterium]
MKSLIPLLIFAFLILSGCEKESQPVPPSPPQLTLLRAYPVEGPGNFQPSGLTLHNGQLFTVSDKNDSTIFEIELKESLAVCQPAVVFDPPEAGVALDFEGITVDSGGTFYLASEALAQILAVSGNSAQLYSPSLLEKGRAAGLFQKHNAVVEALCRHGDGSFWLAAEREPRGILIYSPAQQNSRAFLLDHSRFPFKKNRSFDFSGLFVYKEAVYVLERNAFVVCRLEMKGDEITEGPGWSFEETENSQLYAYDDMRYGKAEGLAMDDRLIYVILDNNGDARIKNPADRRPLLFVFENPF